MDIDGASLLAGAHVPGKLLKTDAAAKFLGDIGCAVAEKSLSTMRSRGGGPRFYKFGAHVLYCPADLIAWAQERLGAPLFSTSQHVKDAAHKGGRPRKSLSPSNESAALVETAIATVAI